tara:strand:+ start:1765 stop:2625 length:861 start_codon:yes stop_codon:yes gene_type:complete
MVNKMVKRKYISINAEILGRAYKIAKRSDNLIPGGLFIWSSGSGLNIAGTDRRSIIFFYDENGYFGKDFHHKSLYLGADKFEKHNKFMRSLLNYENHKKEVHIEDNTEDKGLIRSVFFKKEIDNLFSFKLKEPKKIKTHNSLDFSIVYKPSDPQLLSFKNIDKFFSKIPKKKLDPTQFDLDKIMLIDNLVLRHGSRSKKIKPVTIHIADDHMLCAISRHAFLISMPLNSSDKTIKDAFKIPTECDKNIFELALSKKKYKQIFDDIKTFLPDPGFKKNKKIVKNDTI